MCKDFEERVSQLYDAFGDLLTHTLDIVKNDLNGENVLLNLKDTLFHAERAYQALQSREYVPDDPYPRSIAADVILRPYENRRQIGEIMEIDVQMMLRGMQKYMIILKEHYNLSIDSISGLEDHLPLLNQIKKNSREYRNNLVKILNTPDLKALEGQNELPEFNHKFKAAKALYIELILPPDVTHLG